MPDNRTVYNDANIYFDLNPAIVTNTVASVYRVVVEEEEEEEEEETTSLNDLNDFAIEIFPNPTKGYLAINTAQRIDLLEIFNLKGAKVMTVNNVAANLNISDLSDGIYVLKFISGKEVSVKRVMVSK